MRIRSRHLSWARTSALSPRRTAGPAEEDDESDVRPAAGRARAQLPHAPRQRAQGDRNARAGAGAEGDGDGPRLRCRLSGMGEGGEERGAFIAGNGDAGRRLRVRSFREARLVILGRRTMEHSTIPDSSRQQTLEEKVRTLEARVAGLEGR